MADLSGAAGSAGDTVQRAGARARESTWLGVGIRVGMVAYGAVHLLVGFLAVQLALGEKKGSVSSTGALAQLAQEPYGTILLWVIGLGMLVLVLWRALEAVLGPRDEGMDETAWGTRASAGLKAVIYAVLGLSALQVATSDDTGGKGGGSRSTMTGTVMEWPGGQWLVALAGLAVIGYAVFQAWTGLSEKHSEKLAHEGRSGDAGRAYLLVGKLGYLAKGVALFLVGGLVALAGLTHSSRQASGGLDQALRSLLDERYGPWLVGLVGAGLGCYGLFCFARARHLSR